MEMTGKFTLNLNGQLLDEGYRMKEEVLLTVSESEIRQLIAEKYGVNKSAVKICCDYEFVKRYGDKVRQDFAYGLVDKFIEVPEQNG